jgi:hypothetical protein
MKFILPTFLAVSVVSAVGCGNSDSPPPADIHGNYTLSETNGPSTCPLPNWTQGASTSGIPFRVSQNGSSASGDVGGAGAIFLGLYCGNAHLEGTVSGPNVDLRLTGTRSLSSGSCAFTIDAHLEATVDKDVLTGSISYAPNTNSSPDCAAVRTCTARMNLNGTRPPTGA